MLIFLRGKGFTDTEVARVTRIPQPTISRLRAGQHKDTSYTFGKRIEALFLKEHKPKYRNFSFPPRRPLTGPASFAG
ncbi:hypothetical protein [Chromobacterium haemolyticum]|uniref:hypothetical protein n=1 Tax=Chromobacterium haemolyticum TaxID=394935 RepID=UPI0009DB0C45|nr:hypothetical protein [Chromobacterium haemolyticum]